MIWDALVWLAVAKIVVLLLEDTAYAVRGQQSPRQRERAKERAATATGQPIPAPVRGWERTRAAVGGYLAGLVEDATADARGRRRRALARKRGRQAVDGVFVDVDEDGGFIADCDLCGWSSRPFRIEANSQFAGREHTRTEHPERYHEDPALEPEPQRSSAADEPAGERPDLRVIPGGAAGSDAKTAPAQKPNGRPTPAQPGPTPAQGKPETSVGDVTTDAPTDLADKTPANQTGAGIPIGATTTKENTVNLEATGPDEIRAAFATAETEAETAAEEMAGFAGVISEAAERFEQLQMASSTVEHMREAAESFAAAKAALETAQEQLQAAQADFNAKDGHVADAAADAGNLASEEVLVG